MGINFFVGQFQNYPTISFLNYHRYQLDYTHLSIVFELITRKLHLHLHLSIFLNYISRCNVVQFEIISGCNVINWKLFRGEINSLKFFF